MHKKSHAMNDWNSIGYTERPCTQKMCTNVHRKAMPALNTSSKLMAWNTKETGVGSILPQPHDF